MFRTLYAKLAAVLLGLFCLIAVLYVSSTLYATRLHLQEVNQKLNRRLADHLVAEKILLQEEQVNEEALEDIFHMLMVVNPSIEIYLLNPEGRILAFSAPAGKVKRDSVPVEPVQRFIRGARLPILGADPRDPERRKIFSAAAITAENRIQGYLYVILGGEEYDSVAQMLQGSYILRLSTWAGLGGLLFTLLAGLVLFRLLTQRLHRLSAAIEAFAQTDFSARVQFPSQRQGMRGDEIDRLGVTCTRMAERIRGQMDRLKQTDQLRRELVANVSHDLRTPLASLHGYLETLLLMRERLTPEQRQQYLEIAAKHSERLGELVDELFELAKLDSQETQLRPEPFALAELVQDVTLKFHLATERKRIRLQTTFRPHLPFVCADLALIERVLTNLLENAIRYTPEGGTITVALSQDDGKITVQVKDTGCGIPPEELPAIFDRFYRAERGRPGEIGGAGLGLAIAKRILELHGSYIEASSVLDKGTTFTFSLPVHQS